MMRNRNARLFIGLILIMQFIGKLAYAYNVMPSIYNDYGFTELLINFEGGFVRRGLIGQLLFNMCVVSGANPFIIIEAVCWAVYAFVICFYLHKFHESKLNWWILFSPFMFGYAGNIIRKDYMCYAIAIAVLYLLSKDNGMVIRSMLSVALMVLGLFVHEAFLFFGCPIAFLIMLSRRNRIKWLAFAGILIIVATFVILAYFKGDKEVAVAIFRSWDSILANGELKFSELNSIGAIGWGTFDTFKGHLKLNYSCADFGWTGIFFRPFMMLVSWYFIMNFSAVFCGDNSDVAACRRTLSRLYLYSMICLIPMFTVLSCDYARLYQYAFIMTYAAYLLLPARLLDNVFPKRYCVAVDRLSVFMNRSVVPSKGLMVILLVFLAPASVSFSIVSAIQHSVVFVNLQGLFVVIKSFCF